MSPPSRTRQVLPWCGVGACLLLLASWAANLQWSLECLFSGGYRWFRFDSGEVVVGGWSCGRVEFERAPLLRQWSELRIEEYRDMVREGATSISRVSVRNYGFRFPKLTSSPGGMGILPWREMSIPLWIPFVVIATPTALSFIRRWRTQPGHCPRCGYNLTGNTSGACSECGEKCAIPKNAPPAETG